MYVWVVNPRCLVQSITRTSLSHTCTWRSPVKGGGGSRSSSSHSCTKESLIQGNSFSRDLIKWWKAREPRVGRISSSFNTFLLFDDSHWISSKWLCVKMSSWYKYWTIVSSTKISSANCSRWERRNFLCLGSIFNE